MPGNLAGIPLSVIESWPAPNYINPYTRTWLIPYGCTLQGIMTVMVATRLWLRTRHKAGSLGLDDALLVPAFLAATAFTTVAILGVLRYGVDRHLWDVQLTLFPDSVLVAWISELVFIISTCCTKVSVLLFYRRLTKGTFSRRWKYATLGAIVFTIAYCIAFVLILVLNCSPTNAYWESYSPSYNRKYKCVNTPYLNPVSGALSVFSDLYAVVLPMGMMWHFDAPKRQKVALNAVFSLGLLVVGAGSARTYYLWRLGVGYDITWIGYDVFIWSLLETHLALICASAPALRVLFRTYLSATLSRVINTARSTTNASRSGKRDSLTQTSQLGTGVSGGRATPIDYNNNKNTVTTTTTTTTSSQHSRSWSRASSTNTTHADDKALLKPSTIEPSSLETVREHNDFDVEKAHDEDAYYNDYVVKTPADYEAFALRNLQRHRPQPLLPAVFDRGERRGGGGGQGLGHGVGSGQEGWRQEGWRPQQQQQQQYLTSRAFGGLGEIGRERDAGAAAGGGWMRSDVGGGTRGGGGGGGGMAHQEIVQPTFLHMRPESDYAASLHSTLEEPFSATFYRPVTPR